MMVMLFIKMVTKLLINGHVVHQDGHKVAHQDVHDVEVGGGV